MKYSRMYKLGVEKAAWVSIVLIAMLAPVAQGAPGTMTYQGTVTDPLGNQAEGVFGVRVRLYNTLMGGSPIWEETHATVETVAGRFAIEMGAATHFGALFDDESALWLEVEVDLNGNGFEASEAYAPRLPVTAAPYTLSGGFDAVDAVDAMGTAGNGNPLNHDRYTDAEAVAAVGLGVHAADADAHHVRYTDAEAVAAVGLGVHAADASAHHTRYTDAEAVAAVGLGVHAADASAHHTRYADSEAVAAMGTKGDTNPLHHDKFALSTNAVQTNHIQNGAVTAAKLGSDLQVAFSAHLSANTGGASNPLILNVEDFDIGGNYNAATGVFTAPANGYYEFTASCFANSSSLSINLVLNGSTHSIARVDSSTVSANLSQILLLTVGDTVAIRTFQSTSGSTGDRLSWFTGRRLF